MSSVVAQVAEPTLARGLILQREWVDPNQCGSGAVPGIAIGVLIS